LEELTQEIVNRRRSPSVVKMKLKGYSVVAAAFKALS